MGKPVLLSVDDDPGVSRAVARDLRRRYGEEFRVLRAASGAEALDALRELKLRGDPVAALLADYRMPQMNGIEFLEQAMDLFPRARRALLTAYADTDAAIQAINVVDVDFYLLKPWDPPEEKLYPVVDAMIESWRDSPDARGRRTSSWSGTAGRRRPSGRATSWPATPCPYRWYSVDEPEGQRLLEAAGAGAGRRPRRRSRPTAWCCCAPTDAELAAVVGLSVEPREEFYDLIVVGGGPAGLGRGGLRRVRGAAHGAGRAGGDRRAGRAEQPDRELPRLPRRRLRRAAGRAGAAAGGASSAPRCC